MNLQIHETVIVEPGADIGEGTKIWHWSHVCGGAKIGANSSLGQNTYVASGAIIGNGVKIQNNVSIYDGVQLEDDVFCGPSVVFTNVINPRAFLERKHEYRKTLVGYGSSIGANATIVCGVQIGSFSLIAAGAVVTKDIPRYGLFAGVPAIQIGWVSKAGMRLNLPNNGNGLAVCPSQGDLYELNGSTLECKK